MPAGARGGISPLGIPATIAAFEQGRPWLREALILLERRRDLVVTAVNSLGHGPLMTSPDATYLGWLDLRRFGLERPDVHLRDEAGIATVAGPDHGAAGAGHVRVNFATPDAQLTDFLSRLERVLKTV
ncbi:hypothetical protein [Kutzneria sp. NPDC052558]|uniref:hypothetical protein n=1 Tax=Kutzneria sp. NPDC052558 TaxID=3364121 RepID=UPI0037C7D584